MEYNKYHVYKNKNIMSYRDYQMWKLRDQVKWCKICTMMLFIGTLCFALCAYMAIVDKEKYRLYSEDLEAQVASLQTQLNDLETRESSINEACTTLLYQEDVPSEEDPADEEEHVTEEVSVEEETPVANITYNPYTPSSLTADQFNTLINDVCESYRRSPSEFIYAGYGQAFVDAENTYGVNGLVILGITQAESGLNTSSNAWTTNNPTSICKNGKLVYYESPYESILATAKLLSKYHDKGCNTIYDIGSVYCPINPDWGSVVEGYIERFASYAG